MAWATGTADDFIDLLRQLEDYATGGSPAGMSAGTTVGGSDQWTTLDNTLPGSGFATDGELYMQGPGSDPADEIMVRFSTYREPLNNIWGWKMSGATGYDSGLTWDEQPGSPALGVYTPFDDVSMTYHFRVNGRRMICVAQCGSINMGVYLGFVQQFSTRGQYPYPLLIAGSTRTNVWNFQTNHFGVSSMPDPSGQSAYLRWVDGSWLQVANYESSSESDRSEAKDQRTSTVVVWPNHFTLDHPNGTVSGAYGEGSFFTTHVSGSTEVLTPGGNGVTPVIPACLYSGTSIIARVDGMYVTQDLGLATGDTLTDSSSSPVRVYDVIANTWRTEACDFYALLRA